MKPYPFVFQPILKEKVWGGKRLANLGKPILNGAPIGESWELADLASTSPDGGGGDEARSVIHNGESRGITLNHAMAAMGWTLMGSLRPVRQATDTGTWSPGGFPLLVKFLDANENLSVQTHPSPEYAASRAGVHLKSESWYIVEASAGSLIYAGLKPGVDEVALRSAIANNTVADLMRAVPARAGDVFHLPSGTLHALGAGVLVAEVQTPSDTTYRVYDWGRTNRRLHLEEAMRCIDFSGAPIEPRRSDGSPRAHLGGTEHYDLYEIRGNAGQEFMIERETDAPMVLMVLSGGARIEPIGTRTFDPVPMPLGSTALVPAALDGVRLLFERDTIALQTILPVAGAE
ncbi:MAG: type I phosphomannose isomerase catalytic subunit [Phycisphaerales bacterium]